MNDTKGQIFSGGNVIIILLILKVFPGQFAFGQNTAENFCGTPDLTEYIGEVAYMDYTSVVRSNSVEYYPIQLFSVAQSNGEGRMNELELRRALCSLNEDFLEYGLQFYMKNPIRDINNDDYYEHNQSNGYKMMRNNNVSGAFNIYIVKDPNKTCGYFSPANEAVAVAQSCFAGGSHALTHEMGHYLGLPHTFRGWENHTYNKDNVPFYLGVRGRDTMYVETVDRSNCTFSADDFCDTPPDYISERWNCDGNGKSLNTYLDPNGVQFKVDGTNYMSYSEDRCQNMFTREQEDRMHLILETRYSSRRYKFIPPSKVKGSNMVLTGPEDQSDVDFDKVTLSWKALPDAEEYIVQVSVLPGILFEKSNNILQYFTSDTEITIPSNELKPEQKYYWRIIPVNSFTFCSEPSPQKTFTPQLKSSSHLLPGGDQIRVYPNVIAEGQSNIRIDYKFTTPRQINLNLFNISGQLVSSGDRMILGDTESSFFTGSLRGGLYILHISDGKNVITQKLVVQ